MQEKAQLQHDLVRMTAKANSLQHTFIHNMSMCNVAIDGHPNAIALAKFTDVNFICTKADMTSYPSDVNYFLVHSDLFVDISESQRLQDDWRDRCGICQRHNGFLPWVAAGTCRCKYHLNFLWPHVSKRSCCAVCKVPFVDEMYNFFCTCLFPRRLR